jgi:hypothetical protein
LLAADISLGFFVSILATEAAALLVCQTVAAGMCVVNASLQDFVACENDFSKDVI